MKRVRSARSSTVSPGENCLYFETGQGSALSAGANFGADQVTMEARNYGPGAALRSVPGEYGGRFYRAGVSLQRPADYSCRSGRSLHGQAERASQWAATAATPTTPTPIRTSMKTLMILLATAGCNYIMGMPLGDDIMLKLPDHRIPRYRNGTSVTQPASVAGV
ncbi:ethanolamine ammonia-lyase heavy chain [Citrobacter koseri]|uniref:Ethanolamine ammonia-lyase heavy chain n=1 Tax=Citrobacter koseri TaxID=545 RepID=A0A2X2VS50_CITKO|nr:ethanolamine ammonia-lyase heavy chain [Citrobacter koseri]